MFLVKSILVQKVYILKNSKINYYQSYKFSFISSRMIEKEAFIMKTYGYARVSSTDQNLDRQLDSLTSFGVESDNIFKDKVSGKNFDRDGYIKMIAALRKGDLLVITDIDRLGRNYDMIITEWAKITKHIGADIVVLGMPLLDTRSQVGSLTGRLLGDIVLQLLSYVAQKERENIHRRQSEGIAAAKKRGVVFGRPSVKTPEDFDKIAAAYLDRKLSLTKAAALAGMNRSTFYRRSKAALIL